MPESIVEKVEQSIQTAEGLYHRLVLLVGPSGSGKTRVLKQIAEQRETAIINVNLALSSKLLELTVKQRALRLSRILDQVVNDASTPIILDNLEILFDKDLQQDPLRLLQGLSRNRTVVASWNGVANSGRLSYAEAGHPEYQSYDAADVLIVKTEEA